MNRTQKLTVLIVATFLAVGGAFAALPGKAVAQEHVDRSAQFIQDLADDGVALLRSETLTETEIRDRFHLLFVDRFAVNTIARFLLGRNARGASPEDLREYVSLFEEVTVNQWSKMISTNFTDQDIEVQRAINVDTPSERQKAALVRTDVIDDGDIVARVDWVVTSVGDIFKVSDVTVSGVSLLATQRDEFNQVLRANGGSVAELNVLLRGRRSETETAIFAN